MESKEDARGTLVDPEIQPLVEEFLQRRPRLGWSTFKSLRSAVRVGEAPEHLDASIRAGICWEDVEVPQGTGDGPLRLLSVRPSETAGPLPILYFIHGGGMVSGNRWSNTESLLPLVASGEIVLVSVEYRLAPEHPYPHPQDDCYSGLSWVASHASDFGGAKDQLLIGGASAGGGLAASCVLRARDMGGPSLLAQVLICPMLDDRMQTESSRMLDGVGVWDRSENRFGWTALEGEGGRDPGFDASASPSRESDLSLLPRTYLEVGTAETFRDEVLEYATRLMKAGVLVDLHAWGGAVHALESVAPRAGLTRDVVSTRIDFIRRVLTHARHAMRL